MDEMAKVPFFTGIRRMFYVVTPNETHFENVEQVPEYINESSSFFFMFVLLEAVISAVKKDDRVYLNDSLTNISAGMISRLPMLLFKSLTIISYMWVWESYHIVELPWNSAWTWWLAFLGVDLGYYWFHRMAHEVNFMWAAHQVHHSSESYNFSTALRQSVLQAYTSWAFYLPMALFVPPSVFLVHMELNILFQFWIHTQYIKTLGPLEYILNTPSHHRVHHGRNPYCIDKNYAGTLIIWDRLFGTFQAEEETVAYGLTHPIGTFEPVDIQFGYPKYLAKRFLDLESWKHKVMVLLCGPGWSPGKPRTGDIADIPKVENPVKLYNTTLPRWMSVYVLVHTVIVFVAFQVLAAKQNSLSQTLVIAFLLYLGYCLSCFGRLMDKSVTAVYFELLRCASFIVGEVVLCQQGFYNGNHGYRPWFAVYLQGIFAVSMAVWFIQLFTVKVKAPSKVKAN